MNDYQRLIESIHFFAQPEISWSRWFQSACLNDDELTPFGTYLHHALDDGTFINIPCGLEMPKNSDDCPLLPIAQKLGITVYKEVDSDPTVLGERLHNPKRVDGSTTIETYQADILEYVSTYTRQNTVNTLAWYISGLQLHAHRISSTAYQKDIAVPYIRSLYKELARTTVPGDMIILNDAQSLIEGIDETVYLDIHPTLGLSAYGFMNTKSCPYNKVQVFEKMS